MLSQNKKDAYKKFADAFCCSYTTADALLMFQDAASSDKLQLPLPLLLSLIPIIQPRAYSIASAPAYHGASKIDLCILTYEWDGKQLITCGEFLDTIKHKGGDFSFLNERKRLNPGMCSSYLRDCAERTKVYCKIKPAAMDGPRTQDAAVCVGIGSGVAPLLGYLYDRIAAVERGEKSVAPLALYFGNRFEEYEFLYKEELEGYAKKYGWFTFRTAFSNLERNEEAAYARKYPNWFTSGIHDAFPDGSKTPYVQHVLEKDSTIKEILLADEKSLLFQCGNKGLPKGVQWAIGENFKALGGLEPVEAQKAMERLFIDGRAQQEVW